MIKNYKLFLESNRRSSSISSQEAIDIIKSNCRDFLKERVVKIFRGIDSDDEFLLVKPSEGTLRRSANASNHYTLLIDNSDRWKEFPKRSKSIICTTDELHASAYGDVYYVIPFDGARIGMCPAPDIWTSFGGSGIYNLDSLTADLERLGVSDFDFKSMSDDLKKLEDKVVNKELKMDVPSKLASIIYKTLSGSSYNWDFGRDISKIVSRFSEIREGGLNTSLLDYLDEIFDPKRNRFKITSYSDIDRNEHLKTSKEVWTDSNCIMVNSSESGFLEELN